MVVVYSKLAPFINEFEVIPKTGSGLSTSELKQLSNFNFLTMEKIPLKSGKQPKSHNAFKITPFGREVIKKAIQKEVSTGEVVLGFKHDVSQLREELNSAKNNIDKMMQQLDRLTSSVEKIMVHDPPSVKVKITSSQATKILKQAENSTQSQKLGNLVPVSVYFNCLFSNTDLNEDQINQFLYTLFEREILELQTGPSSGKYIVTAPSGKKYQWGVIRG